MVADLRFIPSTPPLSKRFNVSLRSFFPRYFLQSKSCDQPVASEWWISRFPNLSSQNVKSTKEGRKEREKSEARTTLLRILGGKWASPRVKATRLKGRKLVRSRRGNREHVIATNYAEVARNMALLAAGHLLLAPSSPLLNKLTESCCDSTATTYIGTRPYVTA